MDRTDKPTKHNHVKRQPGIFRKQVNYKWDHVKPNLIQTYIPSLPHDAFDSTGEKITPWSLLRLFDSMSTQCFWPITKGPETPMLYMLNGEIEVDSALYDINSPKYPLQIDTWTQFVKTSSRCVEQALFHPPTNKVYARYKSIDVNIDPQTRRPIPFPEYWKSEFGFPSGGDKVEYKLPPKPGHGIQSSSHRVYFGDTDENVHTNFATYVRFCVDSMCEHIINDRYEAKLDVYKMAMKKLTVTYMKDSKLGDTLTVISWYDAVAIDTFQFHVQNGSDLCATLTISLYKNPSEHINMSNL